MIWGKKKIVDPGPNHLGPHIESSAVFERLEKQRQSPGIVKLFRRYITFFRYRIPEWPHKIKVALIRPYQRAKRGWSKYDVWNLDTYHSEVMVGALSHLKIDKQGYPAGVEAEATCPFTPETEQYFNFYITVWENIVEEMIEGFRAHLRIQDGMYDDKLGPYPDFPYTNRTPEQEKILDDRLEAMNALVQEDERLRARGLELFSKYYPSLWT